jgi:hypothetical protein
MGEEFNYAYSRNLQPLQLLKIYGMVMPKNPFFKLECPISNVIKNFTDRQLELCEMISCLDPNFKMELKDIYSQPFLSFMIDQGKPINWYLINMMRVRNLIFAE